MPLGSTKVGPNDIVLDADPAPIFGPLYAYTLFAVRSRCAGLCVTSLEYNYSIIMDSVQSTIE